MTVDSSIVSWLLDGDVSIMYQTERDLLGNEKPELQKRIAEEGWGATFLSCRKKNGHWGAGFYYPKWTSTHYTLLDLRNLCLPQDNGEGYRNGSPITHAHRLKGNLLLVHGTADDNVHYANTLALVDELIAANKQFSMMAYPNRTHLIREGRNTTRHLFGLLTRFLEQNLPAGP